MALKDRMSIAKGESFIDQSTDALLEGKDTAHVKRDRVSKQIFSRMKDSKYTPEDIRNDVEHKIDKIRKWAHETGLVEGKDFIIIKNISDVESDTKSIAPHEMNGFFVGIGEAHYKEFKDYILGQYAQERRIEDPKIKDGGPKLDFSWGGRFLVGWDGVPFDTVAILDDGSGGRTHHEEFKAFFKTKAGFDFPTSEALNPLLKKMSEGLGVYEATLKKLESLRNGNALPDDGYGLINDVALAIMILKDARERCKRWKGIIRSSGSINNR